MLIALAAGTVLGGILGADPGGAAHRRGVGRRAGVGRPRHPRPLGATEAPEGDARDTLPDRVAQRSLDRPKAERAAQPKGA